ncbi:MAG TPA: hypothetical protein VFV54_06930 [Thermoanaerobaculia bacterium]|nr:hypothetical protein [Thermoanaerobaculia bacterium]
MTIPPPGQEPTPIPSPAASRAAVAIVLLHLGVATLLTPGYIVPDSLGTYAWLRSIVFGGDVLLFDEWAGFRLIRDGITLFKEVAPTGALANHWGIGTSLLSAPAYLLAHAASAADVSANGFSRLYGLALAWMAVLFGIGASLAAASVLARAGVRLRTALFAVAMVLVGTPMLWYEVRFPLGTHLAGVFCVGLLVLALERLTERADRGDLLVGLALGLAVVTRIQHVVLVPAVAVHLWRSGDRARRIALTAAGAAAPLAIQGVVWAAVYGQPLGPLAAGAAPLGGTWMAFGTNALAETLFSSYHGLLPWAPLFALAAAGWILEVRRSRLATTLLVMFIAEWIANGLFDRYFWGGMAFGPRRFVDLAVPAMIGLGWFLRRASRWGWIAAALGASWTALLFLAAASGTLDLAGDVRPGDLAGSVAAIAWSELPRALWGGSALARAPGLFFGGAAIAAVIGALAFFVARSRSATFAASALLLGAGLVASIAAWGPTRERAPQHLTRYRIDVPMARKAGPMLDARALFVDELRFLRNRGREAEARKTEALIRAIDRELAGGTK